MFPHFSTEISKGELFWNQVLEGELYKYINDKNIFSVTWFLLEGYNTY